MGAIQLRRYDINPGELDDFVVAWKQLLEVRRRHGFHVVSAYAAADGSEFTWVVSHDGDFAEAERTYYEDPEGNERRSRVSPHIAQMHVGFVEAVPV